MKSSTETLSPTRVKLTIEVPFEDFEKDLQAAYRSIGSQITVPGFRKGKVPAAVVDQRVGRSAVLDEAINSALPGWYNEAVQETKLQPLSQPEIDLTKFSDGEPIEITAEIDVRPEITLPDVSAIAVEVDDADVSDDEVTEQLEAVRERFATFTEVDRPAADGDAVTIDLSAATKDGDQIPEAQAEGLPYTVGKATMLDGLDEALVGLSKGETATFATELVGGDRKGEAVDLTVTLQDVKETQLPDLDDDLAAMASEFDTFDELKADVLDKVGENKRSQQAAQARDLILEAIVEQVEAPLPEALVTEQVASRRQSIEQQLAYAGVTMQQYLDDEKQTADEFDAELEKRVRDDLITGFVLDQIVETEEIGIEDNELTEHIMRRAQSSGEDPNAFIQHIMEHNHVPEMVSEVVRGKALASLVESAQVTDKSGNTIDLADNAPAAVEGDLH